MVAKALKIAGFGPLLTIVLCTMTPSTAASAQTSQGGVRAEAYARATIMRPAVMQFDGLSPDRAPRFSAATATDVTVSPRTSMRRCADDRDSPCKLIVFDLP